METVYSQLMALFASWRAEIDSEPFTHDAYWIAISHQLHGDGDGDGDG